MDDPLFSLLRKSSSEDENLPPDLVEKNADENPPIAVELTADPTSETQGLSETEPDHEVEEFTLSYEELQRSVDAFERSIQRSQNLSQISEVEEDLELPSHFSDDDRPDPHIYNWLVDHDPYDPCKAKAEQYRVLEEHI